MSGRGGGARRDLVPFGAAARAWFLISLQTFGGPAGQIAVMHRAFVEQKRWIGEKRFLHALNYCMILPGPEAQQLAVYTGWLLNGTLGGMVAGGLFVLPGAVAMLGLSSIYVAYGTTSIVTAVFSGLAPAVLAVVAQAVVRVGRRALHRPVLAGVAVAAFAALALFAVPFPLVILVAGLVGWVVGRRTSDRAVVRRAVRVIDTRTGPDRFDSRWRAPQREAKWSTDHPGPAHRTRSVVHSGACGGPGHRSGSTLTTEGLFFSGTAVVTFGGAYAVLAFVADRAVNVFHWLAPGEMVRGLALAESTPGPLIMVVQFVAFVGAYRNPGALDPWVAAFIGALLTTWVTFVPSFLFIFLGAPYVERLRGNETISSALSGITAAVVGVIANLALFFALHTLFTESQRHRIGVLRVDLPVLSSLDWKAVLIALIALIAAGLIFRLRWSVLRTIGACAMLGVAVSLTGLPH